MKHTLLMILAGASLARAQQYIALPANINQLDPQAQQAIYNANAEISRQIAERDRLEAELRQQQEDLEISSTRYERFRIAKLIDT
jgi:hypothetical protein